jgi:hypothetical protein
MNYHYLISACKPVGEVGYNFPFGLNFIDIEKIYKKYPLISSFPNVEY